MKGKLTRLAPPVIAIGVLVLCALSNSARPQPRDAEPYHQAIREAVAELPMQIKDWQATDIEMPAAAVALLRPNVLLGRQYRNLINGQSAQILFVHCRDARDMAGHYPPVCYPAHGWTLESSAPADWKVADQAIGGTKYRFTILHQGQGSTIIVDNFLLLPNGKIARDMDAIRRAAGDYLHHFYGAAQVQVIFDGDVPVEQQDQILSELIEAYLPVINKVLSGAGK